MDADALYASYPRDVSWILTLRDSETLTAGGRH
jgi:hypothetical protein